MSNEAGENRGALSIEEIDLSALARTLHERFGPVLEESYLDGRTLLRDEITAFLACSDSEAEALVDTLESRGFIRFPELAPGVHSVAAHRWHIG